MAIDLYIGKDGMYVRYLRIVTEYRDIWKMPAGLMHLFKDLHIAPCSRDRN